MYNINHWLSLFIYYTYYMHYNILLQNEEVCGNTIYSPSEARVENMVLPCTSELCNYIGYQVEMVCAQSTNQFIGSISTVARYVGVSILPQMFCHVASSWHNFCANNGTSPVTCLRWRESWLCYHFPMCKLK